MARILMIVLLLVAVVYETPVTYAGPAVPAWLAAFCDDRDDDITTSWLTAPVDQDAHGVAAPPPIARVVAIDRGPAIPATVAHPAFRLRGPPLRTSA